MQSFSKENPDLLPPGKRYAVPFPTSSLRHLSCPPPRELFFQQAPRDSLLPPRVGSLHRPIYIQCGAAQCQIDQTYVGATERRSFFSGPTEHRSTPGNLFSGELQVRELVSGAERFSWRQREREYERLSSRPWISLPTGTLNCPEARGDLRMQIAASTAEKYRCSSSKVSIIAERGDRVRRLLRSDR